MYVYLWTNCILGHYTCQQTIDTTILQTFVPDFSSCPHRSAKTLFIE